MNKVKRIAAIVGIVLILTLIIVTFISAFIAPELFLAGIFSIIVVPMMIYAFIAVYRYVHRNDEPMNNDIADNEEDNLEIKDEDVSEEEGTK
ncbi:hypothetical protein I5677_05245 [Mobilitalea sibirica]|uniref:Uncharacterized protein n=1 Tax=Mobilitalea sibirica TaxID=1462919 RepID=A0A8J7KVL3_9FIRM|nr:hypothetical protein [Mobilitalea sibirica]MBH1940300.1 hypothetical protein [Mobilitalea sibirica]